MNIKVKLAMILVLLVFGSAAYAAPQKVSTDYFKFDASKVDVGNMYHYIASDMDGNYPMDTFVYVKDLNTLAIYKDYSMVDPNQGLVFIVEEIFDWDYMMMERIYAYNPLKDLTYPNQETESVGQLDFSRKVMNIKAVSNDKHRKSVTKTFVLKYEKEPFYDYSLFHIDLQFAMRHLVEGRSASKSFNILSSN